MSHNFFDIDENDDEPNFPRLPQLPRQPENELLTVPELAGMLRLSPQTVYRAVSEGRIPCSRILGTVRFDRKKIEEWLEKQAKKRNRSGQGRRM
jgi:excisionase family DNA binding protein